MSLTLSYMGGSAYVDSMLDPEEPDTASKRRAIALEYWALCVLVSGSLLYGLYVGISSW